MTLSYILLTRCQFVKRHGTGARWDCALRIHGALDWLEFMVSLEGLQPKPM